MTANLLTLPTNVDCSYTAEKARYAKGMMAVRPHVDGTGWKSLAAMIISQMPGVRWSGRERAYICTPSRLAKFTAEIQGIIERRDNSSRCCHD